MNPVRLVLASGNRHKLIEIAAILREQVGSIEVLAPDRFGTPPAIDEHAPDFAGNAALKARGIAAFVAAADPGQAARTWVLADDSGICVDVLDGAPGVISARFAGESSDDAANNAKLVAELRARGVDRSPAHYVCALALVRADGGELPGGGTLASFAGRWDVEVRCEARGRGGFGYDPHAWIDAGARTVAELAAADKARASHRAAALRALVAWWSAHG